MNTVQKNIFLFSVDLEDVRMRMVHGDKYKERVPQMADKYLALLAKYNFKATFFTLGDLADKYPSLIKTISDEGHEIACHSYDHTCLDKFTPVQFEDDLKRNIDALYKAGAKEISGYRAPVFSLTKSTQWVYGVLAKLGLKYSSSVLPAKNPLYGWSDFDVNNKLTEGVMEIPMSVSPFLGKEMPFAGGVYFRALPFFLIKNAFSSHFENNRPVLGYFHPYDIDTGQEHFMHPGINDSHFYNFLMYYKRDSALRKLEEIFKVTSVIRYCDHVSQINKKNV